MFLEPNRQFTLKKDFDLWWLCWSELLMKITTALYTAATERGVTVCGNDSMSEPSLPV
jgi:hypothetical protein